MPGAGGRGSLSRGGERAGRADPVALLARIGRGAVAGRRTCEASHVVEVAAADRTDGGRAPLPGGKGLPLALAVHASDAPVVSRIEVPAPLGQVSVHVVKAEGIRNEHADWRVHGVAIV